MPEADAYSLTNVSDSWLKYAQSNAVRCDVVMDQPTWSARRLAVEILIKADQEGSYANLELDKRLRQAKMDARDKALATELVYGTLRWRARLDAAIANASTRPLSQISPQVLNTLRLTAYQLFFLTHIPAHAAVNEAVNLVRTLGQPGAAGFVNAIARRLAKAYLVNTNVDETETVPEKVNFLPRETAGFLAKIPDSKQLAITWSHPQWLIERWLVNYGQEATLGILKTNQTPAQLVIRVNTCQITRKAYLDKLKQCGIQADAGFAPEAVVVATGIAAASLPGYKEGWFTVQDESSQLVAHALNPQPHEFVADLCSAPGGKTTHLAQLMNDLGEVVAFELHPHRSRLVAATARRLHLQCIRVIQADSRHLSAEWQGRFNRVLLDAPCMGTGVLQRRVDLRWRLKPSDLPSLVLVQQELLDAAASLICPNGHLVYSTCSLEPEENTHQVVKFLSRHPEFKRGNLTHLQQLVPALTDQKTHPEITRGELQLLPSATNDGFFLAVLERI